MQTQYGMGGRREGPLDKKWNLWYTNDADKVVYLLDL